MEIIESHGISPTVVEYLQSPPTSGTLLRISKLVGVPLCDLLRRAEEEFRKAADSLPIENEQELARWLQEHPKVLQRPIVVDEDRGRAVVGRPPENVLALLKD